MDSISARVPIEYQSRNRAPPVRLPNQRVESFKDSRSPIGFSGTAILAESSKLVAKLGNLSVIGRRICAMQELPQCGPLKTARVFLLFCARRETWPMGILTHRLIQFAELYLQVIV